jgi:hypothetical protein
VWIPERISYIEWRLKLAATVSKPGPVSFIRAQSRLSWRY